MSPRDKYDQCHVLLQTGSKIRPKKRSMLHIMFICQSNKNHRNHQANCSLVIILRIQVSLQLIHHFIKGCSPPSAPQCFSSRLKDCIIKISHWHFVQNLSFRPDFFSLPGNLSSNLDLDWLVWGLIWQILLLNLVGLEDKFMNLCRTNQRSNFLWHAIG